MKVKEIKNSIIPFLQGSKDPKVQQAGQKFIDKLNSNKSIIEFEKAIVERKEEFRKIQLNQEIRHLEEKRDNLQIDIDKIPVDFPVPKEMEGVFKKTTK